MNVQNGSRGRRMRRLPGIVGLLATLTLSATGVADEPTPQSEVILLRKCSIEYERATLLGTNQNIGLIQECLVRPGDRVKAGQVVGRMYNQDIAAELETRLIALETSETAIRQSEASLELQKANLQRAFSLHKRNALSVQDLQLQQLAVRTAELNLRATTQAMRQAESMVKQTKVTLAARNIVSPHDGVVVEIFKNVGESINNGSPIYRVVGVDRLRVVGFFDAVDAWRTHKGQAVRVLPEQDEENPAIKHEVFVGKITFIDSEIDPKTRTCRVFAEVENRDGLLRAGLDCRMEIDLAHPTGASPNASNPAPARTTGAEARPRLVPRTSGEGVVLEVKGG